MRQRHCRDCGFMFRLDDGWWAGSGLALPTRCPACRGARRQSRITGTIDRFNSARGFGFVAGDDGQEYFVRSDDLGLEAATVALTRGVRIEFLPYAGTPHPRARRVRVLAAPNAGPGEALKRNG